MGGESAACWKLCSPEDCESVEAGRSPAKFESEAERKTSDRDVVPFGFIWSLIVGKISIAAVDVNGSQVLR